MSINEMIGWDLLYKLIARDLRAESDIIVAVAHWFLIKEAGFRCLGNGDEKTLRDDEGNNSTETLPDNWNENSASYSLRYVHEGKVYILLGTVANDTIILNLLDGESLQVANTALHITDTVKSMDGNLTTIIPQIRTVIGRLKRELLEPIRSSDSNKTTTETQTTETSSNSSQMMPVMPSGILPNSTPDVLPVHPRIIDPLRDIGRGDLDPLGRGGGMIFNPFQNNNPLQMPPRGPDGRGLPGVIPGARFDPFGPIDPGHSSRAGPNPDHFPPPGYDDMFM